MNRRELITLLSGTAAWPLVAHAQQATPVIGFLSVGTLESTHDYVAAFHRSLADGGFAEGRDVGIEYRWSENHNDRLPALAEDLVGRQVTVIVAAGTPASLAAKAPLDDLPAVRTAIYIVAKRDECGGQHSIVRDLSQRHFE
jgi:putative ABC transport system substrate-binding protein